MADPGAPPDSPPPPGPSPEEREATLRQLGLLQEQAAGFFAIWTLAIGLEGGYFAALGRHPEGLTDESLTRETRSDRLYTQTFLRAAYSAGYLDFETGRYRLVPGLEAPLLRPETPVYFGGTARFLAALSGPLAFFQAHLRDGERSWWDQFPPEVGRTLPDSTRTFYTRLLGKGFPAVPGLSQRLAGPADLVELACGRGEGLLRIAEAYPSLHVVGVEGDPTNLKAAEEARARSPARDRVAFKQVSLEEGPLPPADVVLLNLAFHEIQEKERVLDQIGRALRPGGHLLVSEFPFPDWPEMEQLRTPAGKVMAGLQYLEALLDDQLIPSSHVANWLRKKGYRDVASVDLAPIHVLVHGRR
jgi:SAM-dependent methyltransferase